MSDRAALLAAIRQFPDADTPRLVFADWLDEHGESERAAFIRFCVQMDRNGGWREAVAKEGDEFFGRLDGVLKSLARSKSHTSYGLGVLFHEPGLFEKYGEPGAMREPIGFCDRGFFVALQTTAADWLRHADAILAEHPVRRVRLTTWPVLCCDRDHEPGLLLTIFSGESRRSFRLPEPFDFGTPPTNLLERFWDGIEFELPPAPAYQFSGVIQNWTVSTTSVTGGSILTGNNAGGGK